MINNDSVPLREYQRRRRQLMQQIGSDSIILLPTALEKQRNRDVHYPFRPDSDFYYLTGFLESEALLVLIPKLTEGNQSKTLMFCRDRDPKRELWDGRRLGPKGVCQYLAMDQAYPIAQIETELPKLLAGYRSLYYPFEANKSFQEQLQHWLAQAKKFHRSGLQGPMELQDTGQYLHEMRLFKSRSELRLMRKAAAVSAQAHYRAMQLCRPGMMEYQLAAEYGYAFRSQGCHSEAYPSIVGGGENACILHYQENSAELRDGDLVLVDAGGEFGHYAADITRTFPVNGIFSPAQKALYEIVLQAQEAVIKLVKPGVRWDQLHQLAVKKITKGLVDLDLLKGSVSSLIKQKSYLPFYMHQTGHWLGLDVHDVGSYKETGRRKNPKWRGLQAGMVFTVEPGIYISPKVKGVAKRWRGIGIRIEDDILVTETGCEVLTAAVPKQIKAIEQLMNQEQLT